MDAVSKQLKEWSDDYFREAERVLYERGRYRLSDEYKGFERKLLTWNKMNVREREKILKAYFHYVPGDKTYKKPVSSGLKPSNSGKNKRRVRLPEPELFVDDLAPPIGKIIRPDYATNLGDTAGPSNIGNTETDINEPVENSGKAEDSDMLLDIHA